MRRVPPRPAVLLAGSVLVLSLTAASCGDDPSSVAVGAASRATVTEIVEAPGAVTARAAATITAPADGTLADVRVEAGDRVRKGQIVAVIDSPATERRRAAAQRTVRQTEGGSVRAGGGADVAALQRRTDKEAGAAFAAARDAAGKLSDPTLKAALLAQVTSAEQRYGAAARAVTAAVSSVQRGVASISAAVNALTSAQRLQAQQAFELADAAVDALTLRAPVAGLVQLGGMANSSAADPLAGLLAGAGPSSGGGLPTSGFAAGAAPAAGVDPAVPSGAPVSVGAPIMTIVDTGRLGLIAEVDETDVLLVRAGGAASAELDAAAGASYEATVRSVDVLPTASARGGVTYRVRLALENGVGADGKPAPTPRPGMSAIVRLRVRQAPDAVTVPASAVFSVDGHDAVWVVRAGTARRTDVTVGVQGADAFQIVSGVAEGDQVVVGGADQVRPGQRIP